MEGPLQGKVAIITGASTGIGRETALALSRRGACVVLASRAANRLEENAAEIRSRGGQALAVPTDVTDQEQVEQLMQAAITHWGRVDILVSNAGQYIRAPIPTLTVEDLEGSMAVNFYSHVYCTLAVLPQMTRQGSGHIILISSMDAKKGVPPDAPYISAKAALGGFGDVLRQELRPAGIAVTVVYPGRVDTPMIENLRFSWISPKVPPVRVAEAILRAIDRRPAEVILPFQAYLLALLNSLSPRLADACVQAFHLQGWEQ